MTDQPACEGDRPVRFEAADVPAWLPLWLAAGLAGFIVAVLVTITVGFPLADHQQYRGPLHQLPPQPRLDVAPVEQLNAYRGAERRRLEGGAITIEQAMRSTAEQGWGPPP